jgi:hypothetical protein
MNTDERIAALEAQVSQLTGETLALCLTVSWLCRIHSHANGGSKRKIDGVGCRGHRDRKLGGQR